MEATGHSRVRFASRENYRSELKKIIVLGGWFDGELLIARISEWLIALGGARSTSPGELTYPDCTLLGRRPGQGRLTRRLTAHRGCLVGGSPEPTGNHRVTCGAARDHERLDSAD